MIDLSKYKRLINPLNLMIVAVIILFIGIRIKVDYDKNDFVISQITDTTKLFKIETSEGMRDTSETLETASTSETENTPETTPSVAEQETAEISNEISNEITNEISNDVQLAYSSELDLTFTVEAFNKLNKESLMTFSGIGEVTAEAILSYIEENGPLGDFNELMEVKGIGEKKLQKILYILP